MKQARALISVVILGLLCDPAWVVAQEDLEGQMEDQERAGLKLEHAMETEVAVPSVEEVRQVVSDYVLQVEQEEGAFTLDDEVSGVTRTLVLEQVRERVGKTGDFYSVCTEMRDSQTGDLLDLDFDLEASDEGLEIMDLRIHRVNDQPRYTYDEQGNRLPAAASQAF